VSADNGHAGPDAGAAVTAARSVVLVRYRPGVVGQTARTVHVVPLPTDMQAGAVSASCGAVLMLDDIETVRSGEGVPCTLCLLNQAAGTTMADAPPAGSQDHADAPGRGAGGACYQDWGWPVTRHRDQIRLSLYGDVSALAIPVLLSIAVTKTLTARGCAPPVLAHPYATEHRIVLAGERYGVTLPWPRTVHLVTGFLLLPPTVTPRGPITWTQFPRQDSLQLCREIDLFAALRDAQPRNPPCETHHGDPP
jgi:hypothetical protein